MSKYPNGDKVTTKKTESSIDLATISPCSEGISLIYLSSEINILFADHDDGIFHLYGSSSLEYGRCPYCGRISRRVHSRYVRTIQDLSILGRRVVLYLEVRKFFCDNEDCRKKTFAEQPGDEVFRYRRRTCRCERAVARHGISVSSDSACRLLEHLGIHISQFERSLQDWFYSINERCLLPILTDGGTYHLAGNLAHRVTTHSISKRKEIATIIWITYYLNIVLINCDEYHTPRNLRI